MHQCDHEQTSQWFVREKSINFFKTIESLFVVFKQAQSNTDDTKDWSNVIVDSTKLLKISRISNNREQ